MLVFVCVNVCVFMYVYRRGARLCGISGLGRDFEGARRGVRQVLVLVLVLLPDMCLLLKCTFTVYS